MSGRNVLITGASGFVGGRLAERLVLEEGDRVAALIHRFSSPGVARLARLPIRMVSGDVLDLEGLSGAAEGCDVIVHLAYGTRGGPAERIETTVSGTENVLKAALKKKVPRVIYLSTAAVHGLPPRQPLVDESAGFEKSGDSYRMGKIQAEKLIRDYQGREGLAVTVFRPPLIYGPHGVDWTVGILKQVEAGAILVNDGSGSANLIYVDNLIHAILLAIEREPAVRDAFIVVDDEHLTWKEVFERYARMIGDHPPMKEMTVQEIECLRKKNGNREGPGAWVIDPFLLVSEAARTCLGSDEYRHRILQVPWLRFLKERTPRRILNHVKNRGKARGNGQPGYGNGMSSELPGKDLVRLYSSRARFSNEKIKRILGYRQRLPFSEAMRLTEQWLRYQRLIP